MRDFARPAVLMKAAIAALVGTLACLPRLSQCPPENGDRIPLAFMLGWCVFVMWGFVFAWSEPHLRCRPFPIQREPLFWLQITASAIMLGLLLSVSLDAEYRRLFPTEDVRTPGEWIAALLFNLSLQQLFLCFAPLAFFARLGAGPHAALGLTVALSLSVLTMKADRSLLEPSAFAIVGWVVARGGIAAGSVLIYRHGGVPAVWWFALVLQCRHLPRVLGWE